MGRGYTLQREYELRQCDILGTYMIIGMGCVLRTRCGLWKVTPDV